MHAERAFGQPGRHSRLNESTLQIAVRQHRPRIFLPCLRLAEQRKSLLALHRGGLLEDCVGPSQRFLDAIGVDLTERLADDALSQLTCPLGQHERLGEVAFLKRLACLLDEGSSLRDLFFCLGAVASLPGHIGRSIERALSRTDSPVCPSAIEPFAVQFTDDPLSLSLSRPSNILTRCLTC